MEYIENSAADINQADATVCGGITEWKKIAAMCSVNDIFMAPHFGTWIHRRLVASTPNALFVECLPGDDFYPRWPFNDLFTEPIRVESGYVEVPRSPGLGVELNQETIEKYRI